MAANRMGYPTPPPPGEDHTACPVCGWRPCLEGCRLGLSAHEVQALEALFPCDHGGDGDDYFLPPEEFVDPGDFE